MSFSLPYPNSPTNGDAGDADPVRANFQAIAQGLQSFDGSQIQAGSIQESALAADINPRLRDSEILPNFVANGVIWTAGSGLTASMSGGTVYINGYRKPVNAVGTQSFTASSDTYVAVDYLGNITYHPVANNAPPPTLPANSIWLAIVVTNASAVTSIIKSGTTITGDPIYPEVRPTDWHKSMFGADYVSTSGTGTWTITPANTSGNPMVDKFENSTGAALNDAVNFRAFVNAGTYRLGFYGDRDVNRAILTFYVDNVSVGTFDAYSSPRVNAVYQIISNNVTITRSKLVTLTVKATGKNASSAGFIVPIYRLDLVRTA